MAALPPLDGPLEADAKVWHLPDCPMMLALSSNVAVECEHGYDLCSQCDRCTCETNACVVTEPLAELVSDLIAALLQPGITPTTYVCYNHDGEPAEILDVLDACHNYPPCGGCGECLILQSEYAGLRVVCVTTAAGQQALKRYQELYGPLSKQLRGASNTTTSRSK